MADDFRLQEECQNLQNIENYVIDNEHDIHNMDAGEITVLLEGLWLNRTRAQGCF